MPDTQAIQAHWKTTLVILTLSAVLMSLSYTMLIPFLPMYLIEELGVEQSRANFWSGLVFSVSFLISGVMAPIWGAMADKRSRKLMALRAAILLAVSYALGGIVQNEWQLLAMRCFQGFASGLWPACLAIMASTVPRERIGLAMGIMQGGMTAGGVLGPFFGGALAELFSMRMTFFIGGAALAVITLLILFFIHEPPRKEQKKAAARAREDQPPQDSRRAAHAPVRGRRATHDPPAAARHADVHRRAPGQHGPHRLRDRHRLLRGRRFGRDRLAPLGRHRPEVGIPPRALHGACGHGLLRHDPGDSRYARAVRRRRFIGGLTFAGIFPAINAVLTMSTPPEDRGRIFGLSYAAQQVGSVIGPLVGGGMAMYLPLKSVIFLGGFILLPLVIFLWYMRPKNEENSHGSPAQLR